MGLERFLRLNSQKVLKMFFEKVSEISEIASKVGCAIFVVPDVTKVEIKNAVVLEPVSRTTISIEQVRGALVTFLTKQASDQYILIRPADKLTEEAENAILKNLEEPKDKLHFVLVTSSLSGILPTILSRASVYFLKDGANNLTKIFADEKTKLLAKRLLVAKPTDLVGLAEELTKKKDSVRDNTLKILAVTIEMAYKSYFLTGKPAFLNKIPKLILAYENISQNGHIKLHLVADLI